MASYVAVWLRDLGGNNGWIERTTDADLSGQSVATTAAAYQYGDAFRAAVRREPADSTASEPGDCSLHAGADARAEYGAHGGAGAGEYRCE